MNSRKVDLSAIRETANVGVRRAALFLGFSVNCVDNPANISFNLEKHSSLELFPQQLSDDQVAEVKREYRKWAIANSFRELVESFELYLDDIFSVICMLKEPPPKAKKFGSLGIDGKLRILKNEYQIETELSESFGTINKARNCLYHRKGFVAETDLNSTDALEVKWLAIETKIVYEDGSFKILELPIFETKVLESGQSLTAEITERVKIFRVGDSIEFGVKELSELCFHFMIELDKIGMSILEFLRKNGVSIVQEES